MICMLTLMFSDIFVLIFNIQSSHFMNERVYDCLNSISNLVMRRLLCDVSNVGLLRERTHICLPKEFVYATVRNVWPAQLR